MVTPKEPKCIQTGHEKNAVKSVNLLMKEEKVGWTSAVPSKKGTAASKDNPALKGHAWLPRTVMIYLFPSGNFHFFSFKTILSNTNIHLDLCVVGISIYQSQLQNLPET